MKKVILFFTIIFTLSSLYCQNVTTQFTRGLNSSYCGKETYKFSFEEIIFSKTDSYNGSSTYGPSKIIQSGYDNNGFYFETRSPKFILDNFGIDEYRKFSHFSHKILYDERGGNILYVFEINLDSKYSEGKFYFTEAGYQKYCQ